MRCFATATFDAADADTLLIRRYAAARYAATPLLAAADTAYYDAMLFAATHMPPPFPRRRFFFFFYYAACRLPLFRAAIAARLIRYERAAFRLCCFRLRRYVADAISMRASRCCQRAMIYAFLLFSLF